MNIKDCLISGGQALKKSVGKNSIHEAEILLSFVINKNKEFLYTHPENKIFDKQFKKFNEVIAWRKNGMPIAYITKNKEFFGLNFYVNKKVLIPRPETEIMVELANKLIKANKLKNIIDLGTGSGAIAVSLAKINPKLKITAIDISKQALAIAQKNAKKNKVKIKFLKGNLLLPIANQKIDLICANLPYLNQNYLKTLPKSIVKHLKYEPKIALAAGSDGLKIYQKLFNQIKNKKIDFKYLIIEIDNCQKKSALDLAKKYFSKPLEIKKDLAGLNRFLVIQG